MNPAYTVYIGSLGARADPYGSKSPASWPPPQRRGPPGLRWARIPTLLCHITDCFYACSLPQASNRFLPSAPKSGLTLK